jgi:hypothetical protein
MNKALLCISGILVSLALRAAEPLDEWTSVGTPDQKKISDIVFANGIFVSVGADIMVSENGSAWTTVLTNHPLDKVAYDNNRFAGVNFADKTISTSLDGTNWIRRQFATASVLSGFTAGGGSFALCGSTNIWTSLDAVNWARAELTSTNAFGEMSYAGGRYFASGLTAQVTYSRGTANNIWTAINPPIHLRSMTFGNGRFVGISSNSVVVGRDFSRLGSADYAGPTPSRIGFGGTYFVIGTTNGSAWSSLDGTNWVSRITPAPPTNNLQFTSIVANDDYILAATDVVPPYLIRSGLLGTPEEPSIEIGQYPGLTITGKVGETYLIEATPNLRNLTTWNEVARVTLAKPTQSWIDEGAPGLATRYYRATLIQ